MKTYRAAVIGCSRMGGFIDNEVAGYAKIILPYSHAAGYYACNRTDLVACADFRTDVMAKFGERYDIPKEHQYTDYREMIAQEQLDIVSVATQPEPRAEIVIYAAEHGVKAIYAEKAMAASMAEAEAMVAAVERNKVVFNLGTNRRWHPGYDKMKALIDSGELGALKTLIIYNNGTLFNTASHMFDLILRLNNDRPVSWVQAHLPGSPVIEGDLVREDPRGQGFFQFENGVTAYAMLTPLGVEFQAICENGTLTALNDGLEWQLRRRTTIAPGGRTAFVIDKFPVVEQASSTLRLVEDLVHALDTGEPSRGGVRVARASTELIFAFIESHQRGGACVMLPLEGNTYRLQRDHTPRQPKFTA
jgi:predicted dehydrogenase